MKDVSINFGACESCIKSSHFPRQVSKNYYVLISLSLKLIHKESKIENIILQRNRNHVLAFSNFVLQERCIVI